MIEMIQANWLALVLVVIVAVLIALWLVARPRTNRDRSYRPDVLDEGVGPAKRNQALIDAPPATQPLHEHEPPATPEVLGGAGVAVAAAVLANDPANDGEEAVDSAQAGPASTKTLAAFPDNMPGKAEDAQAVAAAVKIHDEGGADDLSRIKGVGPKLVALLSSMGISRYDQIAAWSDADVQRVDEEMGRFKGRIARDDWRTQADFLARGDLAGYEEKFGKL